MKVCESSSLTPHPFSSGCYTQDRAIPGGQGHSLLCPKDTPNHHGHKITPRAGEQPSSCFFQPGGSELWGAHGVCSPQRVMGSTWGLLPSQPPLHTLQSCWPEAGQQSRRKTPLLAIGQALYSKGVPYPDWKYFGKPDDFITR